MKPPDEGADFLKLDRTSAINVSKLFSEISGTGRNRRTLALCSIAPVDRRQEEYKSIHVNGHDDLPVRTGTLKNLPKRI